MKFRHILIVICAALMLTACNFSLAADITPPPNYVSPTPMPTLGVLYPSSAPDIQNGATIFAENCAACHGDKGMGDGPQSMQLPVTVPGIGLPEVARSASPAEWFKIVTQGNLDRFMPPFVGALNDQQRWNVVSYVLTLHTTPEQIALGKSLFESQCADCAGKFTDQTKMAALSEDDLIQIIRNGQGDTPAFGKDFSVDEAYAVAAYLRRLTFAAPPLASTPEAAATLTETASAVNGTSEAVTSSSSTPEAMPAPGVVSGSVEMTSGSLPANLDVTLHGFDHAQDQTSGPQEVLTLNATTAPDGTFKFENVEMPENRIFLAEVSYAGIKYQSGFSAAKANSTAISLSPVKLYEPSEDLSLLTLDQVHIYTDFATSGTAQFLEIYAFSNQSDKSVVISTDGTSIPFIKLPDNAQSAGYEVGQNSAPFVSADKGIAVVPSDTPYSIIAFFSLPYDKKLEINQPFAIEASSVILLIPEGMKVDGQRLTNKGIQAIQNNNYQEFSASDLKAGDTLNFTISGRPKTSSATGIDTRQGLLIGAGVLGILLILAGAFLYIRDRRRDEEYNNEAEFESTDEVMDAILALDDLHRAGKISDEAYQTRREELKEILKDMA